MDLWVQSGHAANYKEDMFVLEVRIFFCLHVFFLED
jgi:threonyl-tRNA synthetase